MIGLLCVCMAIMVYSQGEEEIVAKESEADVTKKLSSCWLISVKDISNNQVKMNEIMTVTAANGFTNRTQVYYKVQMDMIGRCFATITVDKAEQVIQSLNQPLKGLQMSEILEDFSYDDYLDPKMDFELDDVDNTLLKIVKSLEDELLAYKKDQDNTELKDKKDKKEAKAKKLTSDRKKEAVREWHENVERKNAERVIQPSSVPKPPQVPTEQPSASQYIIFATILGVLATGAVWALSKINTLDQKDLKKKSKKGKKE